MDSTRTETRKLTLDEYTDLVLMLNKSLWSIQRRIDEKKESMEKAESRMLFNMDKNTHDLLVKDASKFETLISTIEENSLSLWSDKESGQ
tara:strand:+ start:602 stop:871 length:270 start_codon:yes stop_codon:yes gene_type:complete